VLAVAVIVPLCSRLAQLGKDFNGLPFDAYMSLSCAEGL